MMSNGRRSPAPQCRRWVRSYKILMIAICSTLSACSYRAPIAIAVQTLPNQKVTLQWTRAYTAERGVLIKGIIRRSFPSYGPLWGHLHITATFIDAPQINIDTRWSGSLSGRSRRAATFSGLIETVTPDRIQSISVAYRSRPDMQ